MRVLIMWSSQAVLFKTKSMGDGRKKERFLTQSFWNLFPHVHSEYNLGSLRMQFVNQSEIMQTHGQCGLVIVTNCTSGASPGLDLENNPRFLTAFFFIFRVCSTSLLWPKTTDCVRKLDWHVLNRKNPPVPRSQNPINVYRDINSY